MTTTPPASRGDHDDAGRLRGEHTERDAWRPGTTVTGPAVPPTAEDLEAIAVLHRLVRQRIEPDWHGGRQPDGVVLMPWLGYDPRIWEGLDAVQRVVGVDYEYRPERSEPGVDIRIETATADELATAFTWVVRGERFCDGYVQGLIDDGRLEALLARLGEALGQG